MLVKIYDEQAFQVLNDSFTVSPSTTGYDLYISADGVSYSKFTSVPAGVTRQFVQMSEGNFYKLVGNQGTVTVNWIKCLNGQGGGGTGNLPIASETTLGGIKVGDGLEISEDGVLSSNGGGNANIVELTQTEYDELDQRGEIDPEAIYVIVDAEEIDLSKFAFQADLDIVQDALANKANASNISATNGIPKWNEQGIITGLQTNAGSQNIYINDQSNTIIKGSTWTSGTARLYSPANAGNKGQMLMSNGSGAPVWSDYKFVFLTQDAYDNLATKDSRTLYYIIED